MHRTRAVAAAAFRPSISVMHRTRDFLTTHVGPGPHSQCPWVLQPCQQHAVSCPTLWEANNRFAKRPFAFSSSVCLHLAHLVVGALTPWALAVVDHRSRERRVVVLHGLGAYSARRGAEAKSSLRHGACQSLLAQRSGGQSYNSSKYRRRNRLSSRRGRRGRGRRGRGRYARAGVWGYEPLRG